MSVLARLRRWLLPLCRDDPRFGPSRWFHVARAPERNYWESAATFAGRRVEFFVDAGE